MEAVTGAGELTTKLRFIPFAIALAALLAACNQPFGLGLPSTRALEAGVRASLAESKLEMTGTYLAAGGTWTIDVRLARPDKQYVLVTGKSLKLEAIVFGGGQAYFRGQDFLLSHIGTDPLSQSLARAAGNAWWKGSAGLVPQMPELMQPDAFQRTFLGPAISSRTDHVNVGGVDAVELSGARADVYVDLAPPYRLIRLHLTRGTTIDSLDLADLTYGGYGQDFPLSAPTDVIDFSNLSTLPPIYQVLVVDTTRCSNPCVVSAQLKNLGGLVGAKAPSTITFTMTSTVNNAVLGTCSAQVIPDVGYNGTTAVSCTIQNVSQSANAAVVTATPDNPGRA